MAVTQDKFKLVYSNNFSLENKEEFEVDLALVESENDRSGIKGTILDENNNPVVNATVKLFDANGSPYLHVLTDENGNYIFEDLAEGTFSVACVNEKTPISIPQTVILNKNELETVNFTMEANPALELGTVAGLVKEVLDNEITMVLGDAKVYLKKTETQETVATTTSAPDGEFVFYDVENGRYNLVATKDGYKLSTTIQISVQNGNIVNSTLLIVKDPTTNTGTISGYVKFNNISVSNCHVGLYEINEKSKEIEKCVATTRTNGIGYYMFGNVTKGNYIVKAKQNNN